MTSVIMHIDDLFSWSQHNKNTGPLCRITVGPCSSYSLFVPLSPSDARSTLYTIREIRLDTVDRPHPNSAAISICGHWSMR